ncbi:MAG: serine/threonine-protein kinase [Candidatus Melainabacteria bacterium]|nr:serine/threonine-protein kinase [Candidatus Melainabacteria bacterium]
MPREPLEPEDIYLPEELLDLELPSVLKLGELFADRYQVEALLGVGGMGSVYRVFDNETKQTVALKVLNTASLSDAGARRRFVREARNSLSLQHPHIVRVTDFAMSTDNLPYMVMEYLQGESLADLLMKSGPLTLARFITTFSQIMGALSYAHDQGIVHRDIKPSNIMFVPTSRGRDNVKLVDFGVAKLISDAGGTQELTVLGEFIGSPCYMSPEQCEGAEIDVRTDLYALGCVMYEALTGVRAFRAGSALRIMHMQVHEMPPPFKKVMPDANIPKWLEQLIFKALAKKPSDRYENAYKLKIDLLDGRFRGQDEGAADSFHVLPWESLRGAPFDETSSGSFPILPVSPATASEKLGASTLAVGTISNPQVFKSFHWAVLKLLNLAEILSEEDLNNARDFQNLNGGDLGRILVLLGRINNEILMAAKNAQRLIQLGQIKQDSAITVLKHCQSTGLDFDDALKALAGKN